MLVKYIFLKNNHLNAKNMKPVQFAQVSYFIHFMSV